MEHNISSIRNQHKFERVFRDSKIILTEGALSERLKSEFNMIPDTHINYAGVIYTNAEIIEFLYRQYLDIAQKRNLPIMLMTPTRKVNLKSAKASEFSSKNIIEDSCCFLNRIRANSDYSQHIMIGGLMGCKGDAYSGISNLSIEESYKFHRLQTIQFEEQNIDFLFAGIMPEINEAIGLAKAMSDTSIPYIISFMIQKNGCLLDGTTIVEAIKIIDNEVRSQPICYTVNCVHPINLRLALLSENNKNQPQLTRLKGIQANASILNPEELDNSKTLFRDDFQTIINEMKILYKQFDFKIFGGCCGTNDVFMDKLSKMLIQTKKTDINCNLLR